ncbi:MAG: MlaD family protein [Rubrivivax sp.]|nr:MlaD family protein [Rubrivivax sp.]
MEAEARYTWVGAVVLALLGALVAAVLWLRNTGSDERFSRYAIHFEHQALDGLEVGAEVTLRGIRVGRVEDYDLPGENLNRVRVQVRVDRRAILHTNTVAVVTRNFVTGIAAITLVNGDPPGELLVQVPAGETLPVIGEGRSDMQEIAGRVNKVGEMATIAIANLNQLLSAENREAFMATVHNLRDLTTGIKQRLQSLDGTLTRLGRAAGDVGQAATHVGGAVTDIGNAAAGVGAAAATLGQAGERVATVAESGGKRLDATLAETERAVADAQRAFARIAAASDALQQQALVTANRLEQSAVNIDDQLSAAVTELRLSVETGARVLDRLREPRAALLGPGPAQLGPGEKAP